MPVTKLTADARIEKAILAGKLLSEMNFNQKVWALTVRIPKGKVATYGDIAHKLDSQGYRAVGMAMNRNPYAPAVPCHRVVGADGKLTGFAGGIDAKRKLLVDEKVPMRNLDQVDLCEAHFDL